MAEGPTIKALHESMRDDPMALVMGPAIQAGLYLAARLDDEHHDFWVQLKEDLHELAKGMPGLDEAQTDVMNHLVGVYKKQVGEEDSGNTSKQRVRKANRKVGARGDVH